MRTKHLLPLLALLLLAACRQAPAARPTLPPLAPIPTTAAVNTAVPPTAAPATAAPATAAAPPPAAGETAVPATATPDPGGALPVANPACGPPAGWIVYAVQPGDTLFSLAQRSGTTVDAIRAANCLGGDLILAGQGLYLPRTPAPRPGQLASVTSEALTPRPPVGTPTGGPQPHSTVSPTPVPLPPTSTSEAPPAGGPGDPAMVISPSSGPVGTTYTFSLSEFAPGETVTIELFLQETFELIASGTATVDAAGSGRFQFTSQPVHPAGDYTARATGGTSLAELFGDFRIDE